MELFRKIVGQVSAVSKQSITILIEFYSALISPFLGNHCRFYPSCSLYARIAIERFGIWYGLCLSLKRILKCHPWHQDGYDPVPEKQLNNLNVTTTREYYER
jgi:uncharacterized protein